MNEEAKIRLQLQHYDSQILGGYRDSKLKILEIANGDFNPEDEGTRNLIRSMAHYILGKIEISIADSIVD